MQTCNSITFYFMKNSFFDVSRKWISPNMIRADPLPAYIRKLVFHEIKRDGITSSHGIHVIFITMMTCTSANKCPLLSLSCSRSCHPPSINNNRITCFLCILISSQGRDLGGHLPQGRSFALIRNPSSCFLLSSPTMVHEKKKKSVYNVYYYPKCIVFLKGKTNKW